MALQPEKAVLKLHPARSADLLIERALGQVLLRTGAPADEQTIETFIAQPTRDAVAILSSAEGVEIIESNEKTGKIIAGYQDGCRSALMEAIDQLPEGSHQSTEAWWGVKIHKIEPA